MVVPVMAVAMVVSGAMVMAVLLRMIVVCAAHSPAFRYSVAQMPQCSNNR